MRLIVTFITGAFLLLGLPIMHTALAQSQLIDSSPHFGEPGWEVSLGAGLFSASDNINIYKRDDDDYEEGFFVPVDASYIGESFYFKANELEGLLLGYTLLQNQNWALDALISPRFLGPIDNDLLDDLDDRDPDLHAGVRYSVYFDDSLIRLDISKDIANTHDGHAISASYDKEWQLKNWLITGTASAAYISEEVTDYYYGVDNGESTTQFPVYRAKGALITIFAIGAEYPINENWTFNANLLYTLLDDEIKDSPISIDDNELSEVSTSLRYHF